MADLDKELFDKLREYDRHMRADRAPGAMAPSGADGTPAFQREEILVLLAEHAQGMRQRQLADEMRVSPSTLSVMVGRLVDDGQVARGGDASDKRVALLTLTDAGKERAEEVRAQCADMRRRLYRNLSEDEKRELIRLLDKILDGGEGDAAKPAPALTVLGEGMTCGPDGCTFG